MKRTLLALMMLLLVFAVTGCGDGGGNRPLLVRDILSDETVDGDIRQDPVTVTDRDPGGAARR